MDRERWNRAKSVFHGAARLPPFLRRAWVWAACYGDAELRREVLRLLGSALREDSFLEFEPGSSQPRLPIATTTRADLPDLELIEVIGQGGMGVVYRARQLSVDRIVAVKLLPDLLAVSESRRRAFENESRIVAGIKHPNIVPVFLSGHTESLAYYVMEFVDGQSLDAVLDECREQGRQEPLLEPANVARFIALLANALSATHASNVGHRDIKPGNILVTRDGQPKLVDFGLAKPLDRASLTSRVVGTPFYMSPEQARLRDVRIDHRTDIYSLGVVMYEMLTLKKPFHGRTLAEVLISIREREPVRLRKLKPGVPRDLETICHKAMRKVPDQRYATAADFEADLKAFLEHRSPRAQPPGVVERVQAGIERHRAAAVALCLTALLAPLAAWGIERLVTAHRVSGMLAALPTAPPAEALAAGSEDALAARFRTDRQTLADVHGVRSSGARLDEADTARVETAERLAREDLDQLRSALLDRIAQAMQADFSKAEGADQGRLSPLVALLGDVLELRGDQRPEQSLATLMLPRVTLRTTPPGATVYARRLDPSTGLDLEPEWQRLGTSDMVQVPVAPGFYHFVAVTSAGPYGEYIGLVAGAGSDVELPTLVLRPSDEVAQDMASLPAGNYELTQGENLQRERIGLPRIDTSAPVGAFLIDRLEVTNAQYRRFCEDTHRERVPKTAASKDPRFDTLPVIYVNVYEAEAYAAWAGKRLLTKAEWNLAAHRTMPFPTKPPWGEPSDDASILQRANVWRPGRPEPAATTTDDIELERYALYVRPVGSLPDGRSIEGVFDLLGNVGEWTNSITVGEVADGRWRPEAGTHVVLGLSYDETIDLRGDDGAVLSDGGGHITGIRCGRSAPAELPQP